MILEWLTKNHFIVIWHFKHTSILIKTFFFLPQDPNSDCFLMFLQAHTFLTPKSLKRLPKLQPKIKV